MDSSTGLNPETDGKINSDNIELSGNPEPKALLLSEGEAELWIELKKSRDVKIREKLILKYAHFVKYVAGRIKMHLPDHIEFEDLVSWGTFGLINAVDKYDIDMNIKFVTYSTKRIRGAIIDGLRLLDWVPRGIRSQAKQLNSAMIELEMKLGREPDEAELCEFLKITPEELEKIYEEENKSFVMSLDEICVEDGGGEISSKYQLVENLAAKNPELSIESGQVKEIVVDAINKLSQQERLVITLYYYNELTLKEISAIMSLSDSRVSQLHTKSILRLRGRLSRLKKEIY